MIQNNSQLTFSSYGMPADPGLQTGSGIPNQHYILNQNTEGNVIPRVDVIDTDSKIIYVFEMPGVDPNNINLEIDQSELFISSPIVQPVKADKPNYIYQERLKGKYYRVLNIPVNVNPDEVIADYKQGLLEVSFPKVKGSSASSKNKHR